MLVVTFQIIDLGNKKMHRMLVVTIGMNLEYRNDTMVSTKAHSNLHPSLELL